MEMETDDEDEDGQVGPDDQEQEKNEGPVTIADLSKVWVSRDFLIKHWAKPWFDTLVDGDFSCLCSFNSSHSFVQVLGSGISSAKKEAGPYTAYAR